MPADGAGAAFYRAIRDHQGNAFMGATATGGSAGTPVGRRAGLEGARVLVVEDEPLIALDHIAVLEALGIEAVGPAVTVAEALRLIAARPLDAVLLDANLHGEAVDAVAAALAAQRIPFAFASAYGRRHLPVGFQDRPLVSKPCSFAALAAVLNGLLARPPPSGD